MCTLFEEIARESEERGERRGEIRGEKRGEARGEKRGEIRGEARGIVKTGLAFGLSEKDILERLQEQLHVSLASAQEYLEMFGTQE